MSDYKYWGVPPTAQRDLEGRTAVTLAAGQTSIPAVYSVGAVDVWLNGAKLDERTEFTATDGVTVILTVGRTIVAGEVAQVISRRQVPISDSYTQAQINSLNNNYFGVATGTGDAAVISTTPSVGFTQTDGREVKIRWPGTNTSLTPTANVNGLGVVGVRQGGGLNVPVGSLTPNQELTLRYNSTSGFYEIVTPGVQPVYVTNKRQTVTSGPVDVNGFASEIGVGTGLAPTINGSATPVSMTFAQGFGVNGAMDYTGYINSLLSFPSVPASNLSYLTVDRNSSTGALTLSSTLAPPQYGNVYIRNTQSCLSMNNIGTDDFGNTWVNNAVTYSNTTPIVPGTYMGVFNGTSSNFTTTSITSLGNGSWTARIKFKPSAVASQATLFTFAPSTSVGFGVQVQFISSKITVSLSSNGTSWDIANNVAGNTTLVIGTSYDFELTYDAVAGKYFGYLGGIAESNLTITSASKIAPFGVIAIGSQANSAFYYSGSAQGFEILPYCLHPNGTTFTVPTTLANVATQGYASDWFNTNNYTMNQVSAASTVAGTNPTFTTKQRLYVGEATAGASTISSAVSYAYNRSYISTLQLVSYLTGTTLSSNLGVVPSKIRFVLVNQIAAEGYSPGDELDNVSISKYDASLNGGVTVISRSNLIRVIVGNQVSVANFNSGAINQLTVGGGAWKFKIYAEGF